jgi:hypothetical protein
LGYLQALIPDEAAVNPSLSHLIRRSKRCRWKEREHQVLQISDAASSFEGQRNLIELFDQSEQFGQGGSARRGHPRSATGYFAWTKELSETSFKNTESLHDVSEGPVAFRDRRAIESSHGVVQTFIDDADPQEEIGQQDRVRARFRALALRLLALRSVGARGDGCARSAVPLDFFAFFPMKTKLKERK